MTHRAPELFPGQVAEFVVRKRGAGPVRGVVAIDELAVGTASPTWQVGRERAVG